MLFIILGNVGVAGAVLIAGWAVPKFREKSMMISKRMVKEYLLMMVLFNCFNVAYSLGVQSGYSDASEYSAVNLIVACVSLILALTVCILLYATDAKEFA